MSLELLRVEFRVIGLHRDEDGTILGEEPIGEGAVYPSGLDEFADKVRAHVEKKAT
jgi:hypothetical protein